MKRWHCSECGWVGTSLRDEDQGPEECPFCEGENVYLVQHDEPMEDFLDKFWNDGRPKYATLDQWLNSEGNRAGSQKEETA